MKRAALVAVACMLVGMVLGSVSVCRSADDGPAKQPGRQPAEKTKSLDDQLLRELGDEPDDEKSRKPNEEKPRKAEPAKPRKAQPGGTSRSGDSQPTAKPSSPLDEDLLKQLEGDEQPGRASSAKSDAEEDKKQESGDKSPIDRLSQKMREVQQRLAKRNADTDTQKLEHKILEELEKLIEEAQQQSSSSSSSSKSQKQQTAQREKTEQPEIGKKPGGTGKKQDSPARNSSEQLADRKTEKPERARLHDLMKDVWGELPPRLRQQMMQSSVEQFVPKYELEIEEYFKTLAERQQQKP